MPRFLIVVPHKDDYSGCVSALNALDRYGSHFVTNADFGCGDGDHTAWLVVEVDSRAEAQQMVPPEFRRDAHVVELNRFTREEIQSMMESLKKE